MVLCFWCATILLCICAGCFIIPPLWIKSEVMCFSLPTRAIYTGLLVFLLVLCSVCIYLALGSSGHLAQFYSQATVTTQQSSKLIRPLYAVLQKNLVKYELDLPINVADVDLILSFAQAQAQSQAGVLPLEAQKLLLAVLKAVPKQITALNLLAVHAYKQEQYSEAITYWQAVLSQFTPDLRNTEVENILKRKIQDTRRKLDKQKEFAQNGH